MLVFSFSILNLRNGDFRLELQSKNKNQRVVLVIFGQRTDDIFSIMSILPPNTTSGNRHPTTKSNQKCCQNKHSNTDNKLCFVHTWNYCVLLSLFRKLPHESKMIIPVRCFTCGKVIANKWETYLSLLQADFSEGYDQIVVFVRSLAMRCGSNFSI